MNEKFIILVLLLSWISQIVICTEAMLDCCSEHNTSVHRHLEKDGFHRDLLTQFQLVWAAELARCNVLLVDRLPAGVYVDPYQLARLHGNQHRVTSHVDIEAMAHEAGETEVLTWTKLTRSTDGKDVYASVKATLPIHARYHRADERELFAQIYIDPPQIYLDCGWDSAAGDCQCPLTSLFCRSHGNAACDFRPVQVTNSPTVVLQVPVGDLMDLELVMVGTCVAVFTSCVLLLMVIFNKNMKDKVT